MTRLLVLFSLLTSMACVSTPEPKYVEYIYIGKAKLADADLNRKLDKDVAYCDSVSKEVQVAALGNYQGSYSKISEKDAEKCMVNRGWLSHYTY